MLSLIARIMEFERLRSADRDPHTTRARALSTSELACVQRVIDLALEHKSIAKRSIMNYNK